MATTAPTANTASTKDVLAKALGLAQPGAALGQSDTFVLGLEQKGFLREFFNRNNPLSAYTQMIDIADTGAGSITIKSDKGENVFEAKGSLGNGDIKQIDQNLEVLLWNQPVKKAEGLSAYDIRRGVLNTLAYRMDKSLTKFVQDHIRRGFAAMQLVAGASGTTHGEYTATELTLDNAKKLMHAIIKEATALVKSAEVTRDLVTITVQPEAFDILAFAGLLGDRVSQTFAGGQYSVATLGGYRIQSGEIFMKPMAATPAADDLVAIIATPKSIVSKVDIIAANTGKVELSNDIGTYLEVADITAVPQFAKDQHYIRSLVLK